MPAKRRTAWRAMARSMASSPVEQRLVEHLGQLLGGERLAAAAAAHALLVALPLAVGHLHVVEVEAVEALGVGPSAYCLPRSEKYTSNTVSKARQWAWFFTRWRRART